MTQSGVHATSSAIPDTPYLKWLDLHTAPFLPDPDGSFIYEEAALDGQLGVLQHLVRFTDLLIVITGEKGVGKTTLIRQFLSQYQGWQTCFIQAHARLSAKEVLEQLGCPVLQPAGHEPGIEEQTTPPAATIVVDDAHELPLATLQSLLELATATNENGQRFCVLLAGESPIEDLLAKLDRPLGQAGTYALRMPPLSEEESARYLQHRLTAAGLRKPSPFTATHVHVLYRISDGVPARLNAAAHQLLLALNERAAHPDPLERYSARLAALSQRYLPLLRRLAQPRILIVGATFTLLAALLLLFPDRSNTPPRPAQQTIPLPLPPPREPVAQPDAASPLRSETSAAQPERPAPAPTLRADAASSTDQPENAAAARPAAETRTAEPHPPTSVGNTNRTAQTGGRTSDSAARGTPTIATSKRNPAPTARRESWLLAQDGNHYTLQLLGTRNESAIPGFIKAHQLEDRASYFHTHYQGEDWYVLLYGIYPSREAALAAVKTLPKAVRGLSPWARTLASVHDDIANPIDEPKP